MKIELTEVAEIAPDKKKRCFIIHDKLRFYVVTAVQNINNKNGL